VIVAPPVRPAPRWVVRPEPSASVVDLLVAELKLPRALCAVLAGRGFHEPDAAKHFLRPSLQHIGPPSAFHDMDAAVARLQRAIASREHVMVHGDYDVDGMCATTLLVSAIRQLGGHATPFIPNRVTDGYDLSAAGVAAARAAQATLLVTCDCGTSAIGPIADLRAAGIDVIVTDHHLAGGDLPECTAVLNPKRPGQTADSDLVAVGVAYQLARALGAAHGAPADFADQFLDLVALATVADVGALRGENRILVRKGLEMLAITPREGLKALLESSGLKGQTITAGRVAFTLAPRLNAAGRIASAMRGVELLLTDDRATARNIAHELELLNQQRQRLDREALDEARQQVLDLGLGDASGLVLASDRWHAGVVGIVASRIVEEFGRPAVLVAMQNGMGKGSGRSVGNFDLHAALAECRAHLVRFGGHRAAAGVTVDEAALPAFRAAFNDAAQQRLTEDDRAPQVRIDLDVRLHDITDDLVRFLRHGEPWGVANPAPVFLARGVVLTEKPRVMKGVHVRLSVAETASAGSGPARDLPAIGWNMAGDVQGLTTGSRVDLAFQAERDTYQGNDRLQLKLVAVRTLA
jgi:single-stranded-DNA-specific exonuclease